MDELVEPDTEPTVHNVMHTNYKELDATFTQYYSYNYVVDEPMELETKIKEQSLVCLYTLTCPVFTPSAKPVASLLVILMSVCNYIICLYALTCPVFTPSAKPVASLLM